MKTKIRQQKNKEVSRVNSPRNKEGAVKSVNEPGQLKQQETIENSSVLTTTQKKLDAMFGNAIQREKLEDEELQQHKIAQQKMMPEEEELPAQGKFVGKETIQSKIEDEEELPAQGKFGLLQRKGNNTGMPDDVKSKMEASFNSDFSNVKIHPNSSKAPEVGALAFTQGHNVHFAPGQYQPASNKGQQLLGHELAHVVQQREGRVQPTTEIGGMPVNDSTALENEADALGNRAANRSD